MMCMNNVVIVAVEIHQNLKWLKKKIDNQTMTRPENCDPKEKYEWPTTTIKNQSKFDD